MRNDSLPFPDLIQAAGRLSVADLSRRGFLERCQRRCPAAWKLVNFFFTFAVVIFESAAFAGDAEEALQWPAAFAVVGSAVAHLDGLRQADRPNRLARYQIANIADFFEDAFLN